MLDATSCDAECEVEFTVSGCLDDGSEKGTWLKTRHGKAAQDIPNAVRQNAQRMELKTDMQGTSNQNLVNEVSSFFWPISRRERIELLLEGGL